MLLAEHVREPGAEQRLLRRLQLTEGLLWLHAERGDPYAALLCGVPGGEAARLRERGPLWRSATGVWVVTDHATATSALAGDGVEVETPFGLPADPPGRTDLAAAMPQQLPERYDLAVVARRGARQALAGGDPGLTALLDDAEPALDAVLRAQDPARSRRLTAAVASLRERAARPLLAATGVCVAATLATNAAAALFDAGAWGRFATDPAAAAVVAETLRHAPPARLLPMTVTSVPDWAGGQLTAGDRVVVLLGVANRDPEVFADPDRFDPDRAAAPTLTPGGALAGVVETARAYAEALLTRLAATSPRLRPAGTPVRPGRAPVTATAVRFGVRAD